mmetsp:Transcript_7001/g.42944  ORF Transcript_7001/g.42944 Transcript_7001/m.42944 type:complete len:158 (+) Transcript_7001:2726-3199(+)
MPSRAVCLAHTGWKEQSNIVFTDRPLREAHLRTNLDTANYLTTDRMAEKNGRLCVCMVQGWVWINLDRIADCTSQPRLETIPIQEIQVRCQRLDHSKRHLPRAFTSCDFSVSASWTFVISCISRVVEPSVPAVPLCDHGEVAPPPNCDANPLPWWSS